MAERPKPGQEEPPFLTPEFWGGHSFGDDCAWKPAQGSNVSTWQVIKEIPAEMRTEATARRILSEFLSLPERTPIRTFREGQTFDGTIYPQGSVVRYEMDAIHERESKEQRNLRALYWGVIIETDGKRGDGLVIMRFSEGLIYRNNPRTGSGIEDDIVKRPGEVEHWRMQEGHGFDRSQSLVRTNWVDLMAHGKGIRRTVEEKVKAPLFGKLFPSPA